MAHKLTTLSLALAAALALTYLLAAGAHASTQFTAAEYPAVGEATPSQKIGEERQYLK
jgi:hypothetical protein